MYVHLTKLREFDVHVGSHNDADQSADLEDAATKRGDIDATSSHLMWTRRGHHYH
jgi:hypothetical protein